MSDFKKLLTKKDNEIKPQVRLANESKNDANIDESKQNINVNKVNKADKVKNDVKKQKTKVNKKPDETDDTTTQLRVSVKINSILMIMKKIGNYKSVNHVLIDLLKNNSIDNEYINGYIQSELKDYGKI